MCKGRACKAWWGEVWGEDRRKGRTMAKECPVCQSDVWANDVVTLDGITFCGECWWLASHIARRLSPKRDPRNATWGKAISLAHCWRQYRIPDTDTIDLLLVSGGHVREDRIPNDYWRRVESIAAR